MEPHIGIEQGEPLAGARNRRRAEGEQEPLVVKMPVDVRSASLSILAVLGLIFFLHYAQEVFVPALLAILISYALEPFVTALRRVHVPRPIGAAVAIIVVTGLLGGTLYYLRDGLLGVIEDLPTAARRLRETLEDDRRRSPGAIAKVQKAATEIEKAATAAAGPEAAPSSGATRVRVEEPAFRASDLLYSGSLGATILMGQMVVVVFLAYFLLMAGNLYKRKLVRMVGPEFYRKRLTVEILDEINSQIERFLLYTLLSVVIKGVATAVTLWWVGLENAGSWGLIAGLLTPIPYLGPGIVVLGTAVAAFLQFGTTSMALWVGSISFAIAMIEGWLLIPALMGHAARMNQVAVFIGLLFWTWIWGVWGLILAVPMLMVVKTICDHVEELQPIGELLGDT